MKLLTIIECPLEKIGDDYYAGDPWILILQYLSTQIEEVTLWIPTYIREKDAQPRSDMWKVDLNFGKLKIVHHDPYKTFSGFYRILPLRFLSWRKRANQLIRDHDAVLLRLPSPMLTLISSCAEQQNKPLHLTIAGDMLTQSDRILGNTGLKRLFYKAVTRIHVWEEVRCARKAAMVYAYSEDLLKRHQRDDGQLRYMMDTHISLKDIIDRNDTCQSKKTQILRACWLTPSKGLEQLIKSIAILRNNGFDVELEIIGKERVAGYQASLEKYAQKLNAQEWVHFSGWIPFHRISEAYLRSDIQVVSSLAEGTPRVVQEGLAHGLPLVCTRVGGCTRLLTHEKNALLVPPSDPKEIASAVQRIIVDGKLRRELIQNGYELARSFTSEELGSKLLEDVREMVNRKQ